MMKKSILLLLFVLIGHQFCFGQKLKIYLKAMLGTELPVNIFDRKKNLQYPYDFNRGYVFGQPLSITGFWYDKVGIELQFKHAICYTNNPDNFETTYPGKENKIFYVSKHNFFKSGDEYLNFRMGLVYNLKNRTFSVKPKLLLGLMILPAENVSGILKEQGTNIYYTVHNDAQKPNHNFRFLSISAGANISKNFDARRAINLEVLYNHSNTPFSIRSELTNAFTKETTSHTISQRAGIGSISFAIGLSFYLGAL